MFADPLLISPDALTIATSNQVTFSVIETQGKMRKRKNSATTPSDPENMVINHFVQGSEAAGTLADRHLIQLSRVERDTAGKPFTCVVNLTLTVPRNGLFSTAEVTRQIQLLANFVLASGKVASVLDGES